MKPVLAPVLGKDTLLVTDGNNVYPPCAAALGVSHEALNQSKGERVRGELRIQTVNSRHEASKPSCAPVAALPQNTSTATSGGSTSPASSTIPRPEHASMPPSAEEPK